MNLIELRSQIIKCKESWEVRRVAMANSHSQILIALSKRECNGYDCELVERLHREELRLKAELKAEIRRLISNYKDDWELRKQALLDKRYEVLMNDRSEATKEYLMREGELLNYELEDVKQLALEFGL